MISNVAGIVNNPPCIVKSNYEEERILMIMKHIVTTALCGIIAFYSHCGYGANPQKTDIKWFKQQIKSLKHSSKETQSEQFRNWLRDETSILSQLLRNIIRDQKRFKDNSIRLSSQIVDLNSLIKEIKKEIEFQKKDALINYKESLNVCDFGAKGNGVNDDGPAIRKAIETACEKNIHRVFIPAGQYYIKNTVNSYPDYTEVQEDGSVMIKNSILRVHIPVTNRKNLLIEGETGTTLIMGKYETGVCVAGSDNITLKNLAIDYRPLPFTQGRIAGKIDRETFDVKIDKGFPEPNLYGLRPTPGFVGVSRFFHKENLPGKSVPATAENSPNQQHSKIIKLANGLFRYSIAPMNPPRTTDYFEVEDRIITYARRFGNPAVMFSDNNRCTAKSITVYASPTFAFFSQHSRFSTFLNCKTQREKSSKRLTTTSADGIMIHRDRLGPYISNCTLTCLGDDYINIHSFNRPVISIPATDTLELNACGEFKTGDRIGLIEVKQGKYKIIETSRIKSVITVYCNNSKLTRIRLESSLNKQFNEADIKQKKIQVFSPDIMSHGFVIRDSKFLYGVSRMLIGGRNGLIVNNVFKDNLNHHELLRIGMRGILRHPAGELYFPRNIRVANNKFEVNYDKNFIEVCNPSAGNDNICHLHITGNIFTNYRNSRGFSAVKINGLDDGRITGNTFIPGGVRKSRYSGSTISETAIEIDNASNILIRNNKIASNTKGQIQIGKNTKNIIQK